MRGMGAFDAPFFKIFVKSQIHGLVHEPILVHAERMVDTRLVNESLHAPIAAHRSRKWFRSCSFC